MRGKKGLFVFILMLISLFPSLFSLSLSLSFLSFFCNIIIVRAHAVVNNILLPLDPFYLLIFIIPSDYYYMKSTSIQQHYINNHHVQQNCCCCCCYCCCYHQQSSSDNNNAPQIPPWSHSNQQVLQKPTLDSTCSCCSCISNDQDKPVQEDEDNSTGRTTPIDLRMTDDTAEKFKRKKMHAIEELLQTERDYVQDLSYLVQVSISIGFVCVY